MSKSLPEIIRKETIILDKSKLKTPKGVKVTKPLEVNVSLICEAGALYSVFIEGSQLIPRRRLAGLGDLEYISEIYRRAVRKLRKGNYYLESDFEIKVLIED